MLIFELDQGNSGINIWYKFNENPSKFVGMRALTKKCDGRTHGRTDGRPAFLCPRSALRRGTITMIATNKINVEVCP